ncbi:hypothetical protein TD95_000652 [Thielaviopsis punctulata]|uniref:SPX domain-containing protein n=1 Tax=Thielaviopsis punctulata TaxID=72032 RepID=A0A0F4ZIN3_9PEZI|nr:hypothetical protein TD95_000652 [Thielaviopsis punctulata]
MKFAKELDHNLVPEWRAKYLDYRTGKKLIKGVTRALNRVSQTPAGANRGSIQTPRWTAYNLSPSSNTRSLGPDPINPLSRTPLSPSDQPSASHARSPSQPISVSKKDELASLSQSNDVAQQYGSFVPTPNYGSPASGFGGASIERRATFELPEPALDEEDENAVALQKPHLAWKEPIKGSMKKPKDSVSQSRAGPALIIPSHTFTSALTPITPAQNPLRRFFPAASPASNKGPSVPSPEGFEQAHERSRLFFKFLDAELEKVETFYKQKEDHAGKRLDLLRAQLHEMRNRRLHEMAEQKQRRHTAQLNGEEMTDADDTSSIGVASGIDKRLAAASGMLKNPFKGLTQFHPKPGPNSRALANMTHSPRLAHTLDQERDARRDYIRKPRDNEVPYRTAKRKLKLALQEFYRGLELLKAYALLNRTAFRKLNKKYDKAVHARPPLRYVNEKVNKAWFVQSDVLDGYIVAVEDLYARYFEKGQHKVAVGKLRSLTKAPGDFTDSAFFNGLLLGLGLVFGIQGVVHGVQNLYVDDARLHLHTSYLLQIYAGYFLMLLMFTLFCMDCWIWTKNKVNYQFIFELDPRHQLDWRQMAEFPSFMGFMLGFFLWLNFSGYGSQGMYLYYPVILIGLSVLIIFFPAPVMHPNARKWFVYSHWRLVLAGLYPVEFRDFFLGDIYCSLTYATCNVALFFCLYDRHWNHPEQCNSSHSRIMGFLSALPPIWRFLQCIRRYYDTRNWFPHLVNCGKYTMSIMAAVSLSLYRISHTDGLFALFVTFGCINGLYTAVWDLFMDFSVLQPGARKFLLRDITALKKLWMYYAIMAVDPLLRFSWIFYAIFRHDVQHSAVVSFGVAVAEVCRRAMWTLLRVENEHCTNVAQYKASRDVPLPYKMQLRRQEATATSPLVGPDVDDNDAASFSASTTETSSNYASSLHGTDGAYTSGAATGPSNAPTAGDAEQNAVRRRRSTVGMSFSKMLAEAHRQDFEKKRKPADSEEQPRSGTAASGDDDDDDDDDLENSDSSTHDEPIGPVMSTLPEDK